MEYLSNDHENHPNQHENSHKLCNETGTRFEFIGESMETETTTLEYPNRGKAIAEQLLASEEINPKELHCESHSQEFE